MLLTCENLCLLALIYNNMNVKYMHAKLYSAYFITKLIFSLISYVLKLSNKAFDNVIREDDLDN